MSTGNPWCHREKGAPWRTGEVATQGVGSYRCQEWSAVGWNVDHQGRFAEFSREPDSCKTGPVLRNADKECIGYCTYSTTNEKLSAPYHSISLCKILAKQHRH